MSGGTYEGWAVLELMGHRRRAGFVREVEAYGGKLLRIDVPTPDGDVTEFYGCTSIYAMRPTSERVARDAATRIGDPRPIQPVVSVPRPTIGRIVHYIDPPPNPKMEPRTRAAIITWVYADSDSGDFVSLTLFEPGQTPRPVGEAIPQGDTPGHWRFPPILPVEK